MSNNRKYPCSMEKSEWKVPSLKVGDVAVVLFGYRAKEADARFNDVCCGNTTVVDVSKTGAVTLANGYKFHATGYGFSKNSNMVLATRHAIKRTKYDELMYDEQGNKITVPADQDGHHSTFDK